MKIAGIPVVDANKNVIIKITARDVRDGKTKDPGSCAAARACMRDMGASQARVHLGRTYLKVDKKWIRFETPAALRAEIISFDRGHDFQAGSYVLRKLRPSHKVARGTAHGSSVSKTKPYGAKKKARAKPHVVHGVRAHGANR